ncbi:ParB N-terminal domain-containing protein [Saliphagus sp. GCM10025334]
MSDFEPAFETGEVVIDREYAGSDPNRAVVVNQPPTVAHDWEIFSRRKTLAEDNPEYPEDDRVVIVVYKQDLEEVYPYYTGAFSIRLSRLNQDGVKYYSFPESRLKVVDSLDSVKVNLSKVFPSPYHSRNFTVEPNRDWIAEIGRYEYPVPFPLVRDCGDWFELINGHKRVWAAHLLGLEEIYVECSYIDDEKAAVEWAGRHLLDYDGKQQDEAFSRIIDRFGNEITESYGFPDLNAGEEAAISDGGQ